MRDRSLGATIEIYLTTHTFSTGVVVAPSSAFTSSDFKIYKDGSATEKTTTNGITVTSPFDGQTGGHLIEIDTSNNTGDSGFWASGSTYRVILSTAKTVDSKDPSGVCVGEFSLELQTADIRKVGGTAQTAGDLAALLTTLSTYVDTEVAAIKAKTDNLPADPADASDISGLFTTVNTKLDTIDDFLDTEISAIKAKTDNLPTDPADQSAVEAAITAATSGLASQVSIDTLAGYVDTEVSAIKAKTDNLPTDPADQSAVEAAITAATSGLASQSSVNTLTGYVDTEVASIKAIVDKFDTMVELDGSVYRYTTNSLEQGPAGSGVGGTDWNTDERSAIRTILGIPLAGTTPDNPTDGILYDISQKTVNLPSDPADASDISSSFVSINAKLDTIDDFLDTEIVAIKSKTDNLPVDPADQSAVEAAITSAVSTIQGTQASNAQTGAAAALTAYDPPTNTEMVDRTLPSADYGTSANQSTILSNLSIIAGYLDTEIAAIKAKTDNLPADPTSTAAINAQLTTLKDRAGYLLSILAGQISNAGTSAEQYAITIDGNTFTVTYNSLQSDGDRSTTGFAKT
jgi:hypothetical protein